MAPTPAAAAAVLAAAAAAAVLTAVAGETMESGVAAAEVEAAVVGVEEVWVAAVAVAVGTATAPWEVAVAVAGVNDSDRGGISSVSGEQNGGCGYVDGRDGRKRNMACRKLQRSQHVRPSKKT